MSFSAGASEADHEVDHADVVYLVVAHRRPHQVVRLARRILDLSPRAAVLVHWDRRAREAIDPAALPERARVIPARIAARWGSWGLVAATLDLLREATALAPSWYVLVSGEDWPVVDLAAWERELADSDADAVLRSDPVNDRWAAGERGVPLAEDEVRRYGDRWHVIRTTGWSPLDRVLLGVARRVAPRVRPRSYPAAFDFYGRGVAMTFRPGAGLPAGWTVHRGDQWVTLGARAVDRVLAADPQVIRHFRRTLIPDEAYVHTVLLNDPEIRVREGRTSFAPWARFGRAPHLVLQPEDLDDVRGSGAPFARKVGDGALADIVADLDRLVVDRLVVDRPVVDRLVADRPGTEVEPMPRAATPPDSTLDVSVVVCTRNRADRLARGLAAVRSALDVAVDDGLACELIVVDNGSTDATSAVVKDLAVSDSRVRGVVAPIPGIARARNRGLDEARGAVVLFTDDDTVVPPEWVVRMARPILDGAADAIAGGVVMAADLRRPWMTPGLTARYYADVPVPPAVNPGMACANAAVSHEIARRFRFDEELGTPRYPGAEDVLLYVQILEAGYTVRGVLDAPVEHHVDPARLEIDRLEALAEGYGRCDAFFYHHWLHATFRAQRARVWLHRAEHAARWLLARGNRYDESVLRLRREVAFHTEMLALRGTPRRYACRGLELLGVAA